MALLLLGLAVVMRLAGEEPATLYKGMGAWHHPIATRSQETQRFFDQGLTLATSFNRYEALRSFRKASVLDPAAAMPYWGMAIAQGPYINMDGDPSYDLGAACRSIAAGLALPVIATPERAYLQAASAWCPEYKPQAAIQAAELLASAYPDDPDAQVFLADSILTSSRWHWYDSRGVAAAHVGEAEQRLEIVLRRWPQHPGANHLYVHATESSKNPERAIASAQRLMGVVPGAGHMVHMPGHIWLLIGDWEAAASVNERAAAVDRDYFASVHPQSNSYWQYYVHNLHFILYARSMQGQKEQALRAANMMEAASLEMKKSMPEMADAFAAYVILIQTRMADWAKLQGATDPGERMPLTRAAWGYARVLLSAKQGNLTTARLEGKNFEQMRSHVSSEAAWGQNKAADVMSVAAEAIQAAVATDKIAACRHWQRAVELQDQFTYDEPPAWHYPLRESLGACLLQAGQKERAVAVFREGVKRSPRNGRMLFGLWQSLVSSGDEYEAGRVQQEYEAAWSKADMKLRIEDL